jgi:hypothetical protein
MENEPDETAAPDEPVTETDVAHAIQALVDGLGTLEARQFALRKDMDNLTECFRQTLKVLRVLAAAVSVHDKALNITFPELPEPPAKVN